MWESLKQAFSPTDELIEEKTDNIFVYSTRQMRLVLHQCVGVYKKSLSHELSHGCKSLYVLV